MAFTLVDSGALVVKIRYVEPRGTVFYFRRRIPDAVRSRYGGDTYIMQSLRTSDPKEAAKLAQRMAQDQNALWKALKDGHDVAPKEVEAAARALLERHRLKPGEAHVYNQVGIEPDAFLDDLRTSASGEEGNILWDELPPIERRAAGLFYGEKRTPTFTEARAIYVKLGKVSKSPVSNRAFWRVTDEFLLMFGDLPITSYDRAKAHEFVMAQIAKGHKATGIDRNLNYLSPLFRVAIREFGITMPNPFEATEIPNKLTPIQAHLDKRPPVPLDRVKAIQDACRQTDDERRWIISLLTDTGARLGEIVFLRMQDIFLDVDVPHISITPYDDKSIKAIASVRKVPLLGEALWAAQRVVQNTKGPMAFPVYNKEGVTTSNSASAALLKWLRDNKLFAEGDTLHGLRHTMRDRCRDAKIPLDVAYRLGGWKLKGIGEAYGTGHSLKTLRSYLAKAVPLRIN